MPMIERNMIAELAAWKNETKNRRPLLLYGARQVGKTHLLQEFGNAYYKNVIYVNFERMPIVREFFLGDLGPERIVRQLEEHFGQRIIPEQTLLIFDEIQACEHALTSLKYFCEEAPEYHVAGAGSLLGVAIHRENYSFPVGKVVMKTLYPLSFDEFLHACGQQSYVALIRECYHQHRAMPPELHQELLLWYRRYLFVGGMPAVVKKYVEEEELINLTETQMMIIHSYTADMAKYASSSESTKIQGAFESLPAQLARENKKFQYKLIRRGATAGLFGDSINWLVMAGVALKSDCVNRGEVPLKVFRDVSAFKLYMSDVGLLSAFNSLMPSNVIHGDLSDVYKGALTENYVAQVLTASGYELCYWTDDLPAEVDFVIQKEGKVIPIEVKAGENIHARSIKHYCKLYEPEYCIRLSARNFGEENGVWSVPLYAAFCI